MKNKIKELLEYIENNEYGEYLEGLINFNNVVRYSNDDDLVEIIEDQIERELKYCKENFEVVWHKEETTVIHKWKEVIEK